MFSATHYPKPASPLSGSELEGGVDPYSMPTTASSLTSVSTDLLLGSPPSLGSAIPPSLRGNPYEYAAGDPINRVDPSGKFAFGMELAFYFYLAYALKCYFEGCPAPQDIPFPDISPPLRSAGAVPSSRNQTSGPKVGDASAYGRKGLPVQKSGIWGPIVVGGFVIGAGIAGWAGYRCYQAFDRYIDLHHRYKEAYIEGRISDRQYIYFGKIAHESGPGSDMKASCGIFAEKLFEIGERAGMTGMR